MKKITQFLIYIFITQILLSQVVGDNWNHRVVSSYANEEEVARISITFLPGFSTTGHNYFRGYIDPNLPLNGGSPVSNGIFDLNYIRIYQPLAHNSTTNIPQHSTLDYNLWSENISYFDGLGREVQKISVKASGYGNDIVQPIEYDDFGRVEKNYLPYVISQSGTDGSGGYRSTPIIESQAFYSNYFGDDDGSYAFSKNEFDGSPLNRVKKQSSPGSVWRMDGGKVKEFTYETNTENEVTRFKINDEGELVKNNVCMANTLYKNSIIDEEQNKATQYKNAIGQVILKKGEEETFTYYVYDDFGLLRYVIPPLASSAFVETNGIIGDITNETIDLLCYYYEYDNRKRMKAKKIPGADIVYMVYNNRDQIILTQDGEQRLNDNWSFTKYDVLNRPVSSGIYKHGSDISQENMQIEVNQESYDLYETYIDNTGYSNQSFPITDDEDIIHSLNYYDNYDALQLEINPNDYQFLENEIEFYYPNTTITKGFSTISKTKVLTNDGETVEDDWLLSVAHYDKYGRVIQSISDNHLGGKDIVSSRINYTGDIVETRERHIVDIQETNIRQKFEYDNAKRLTKAEHKIDDQEWIALSQNKYSELGQLSQKQLHGENDIFTQSVEYNYNIRGWLTDMNNPTNLQTDLFAIHFDYNTDDQYSIYNGNISAISWTSSKFPELKKYNFQYDALSRLTDAVYNNNDEYTTHYNYDKNGNFNLLTRNCLLETGITQIDNLAYEYNGNQLKNVNDGEGVHYEKNGFKDNGIFLETEYFYDHNGNMNRDLNKGIENITYNYLNLPMEISFDLDESKKINYTYTANGIKLRKQTHENGSDAIKTDYSGSFVYENDTLLYVISPEGRLIMDDIGNYNYQYFLKDHLGNTRVMFSETGDVLQDNSYYPFGMSMGQSLTYNFGDNVLENMYLYNGKEIQTDFGLDWYDYGARMYDPTIGRWNVIDALAEDYFALSPYNYVLNNPVISIDPNGMGTWRLWDIDENNATFGDMGEKKIKEHEDPPSKERDSRTVEKKDVVEIYDEPLSEVEIVAHRSSGQAGGGDNTYMAGALVLSGVLAADDVTGVGVADDIAIPFILVGAYILDRVLNPNLEGTSTSRGNPTDWSFDPEINRLQNDKYYPPGSEPPRWFWPAIGGAGAYELYKNWPKPQPIIMPADNTYVYPRPIYPYP